MPPATSKERAELIVRLEEILETEYSPLDTLKIEADMKALALGVLTALQEPERQLWGSDHVFDPYTLMCMRCGKSKRFCLTSSKPVPCTGE